MEGYWPKKIDLSNRVDRDGTATAIDSDLKYGYDIGAHWSFRNLTIKYCLSDKRVWATSEYERLTSMSD